MEVDAKNMPLLSHFRAVMVFSWALIDEIILSLDGTQLKVIEPSIKPIANGFCSSYQSIWATAVSLTKNYYRQLNDNLFTYHMSVNN